MNLTLRAIYTENPKFYNELTACASKIIGFQHWGAILETMSNAAAKEATLCIWIIA